MISSKHFSMLLCLQLCFSLQASSSVTSPSPENMGFWTDLARSGVIIGAIKVLNDNDYKTTSCVLGGYVVLSELDKQNKNFFNGTIDFCCAPLVTLRKVCERFFCGGESLSWNELITWRTRVMKLLSPLTKQTTVVDLSREKRLRLIDQEGDQETVLDEQWKEYSEHIQRQCTFMIAIIERHLHYYRNELSRKCTHKKISALGACLNTVERALFTAGKKSVRVLLKREEETAFYLEELKHYLQEIIDYTKSVDQLSALDKDRVKRMMNSTCDTFEHIATVIDPNTASAGKNAVGQLTVQKETGSSNFNSGFGPGF